MIDQYIQYFVDEYQPETHSIKVAKTDFTTHNPVFTLMLEVQGKKSQKWTLEVIGHYATQLIHDDKITYTEVCITDNHPLLWEYTDVQGNLIFNGKSKHPEKLIHDLKSIDHNCFFHYRGWPERHYVLLEKTSGILATGSHTLLKLYEKCLNEHGIGTSFEFSHQPKFFDGNKNYVPTTGMQIFVMRQSFIIGKEFIFRKVK